MTLAEIRKSQGLTQVELAKRMGISQHRLSNLEHSQNVRISTLHRFIEALGGIFELIAVFGDQRHSIRLGDRE